MKITVKELQGYVEKIENLEKQVGELVGILKEVQYFMQNSEGVAGWNLNGDVEPWERMEITQRVYEALAEGKE